MRQIKWPTFTFVNIDISKKCCNESDWLRVYLFQVVTVMTHYQMQTVSVRQMKNVKIVNVCPRVRLNDALIHDDAHDNVADSGCDCDETLPNADDFCPVNSECKQCKCLPAGTILYDYSND